MSGDTGAVYLVGAGPGDPELLTVKAKRLVESADAVLYDSLVGDDILGWVPETATLHDVGKTPGGERTPQDQIHRLMATRATEGERVVRLKGGDPTVFGRGGEEAEYLAAAGVEFVVVPGVSSAVAAPAVAGIPVTHRDCSSSFTVVTGHEDPTKARSSLDWGALASTITAGGTLVILMGVRRLPTNVDALLENGVDGETPVAMVQRATCADERTVTGTLAGIVESARRAGIDPPAVTVVGAVVDVREDVADWLGDSALPTARAGRPGEGADSRRSETGCGVGTEQQTEVFDS